MIQTPVGGDVQSRVASSWWRLWAIAVGAHMISNVSASDAVARGFTNTAVGLLAIGVLLWTSDARLRTALAAGVVLSALVDAPLIGNHWWLAAIVSAAALLARPGSPDWWARFAPAGRILLLTFYSFAAFAKLNSGFFDAAESCARHFTNQTLGFWQLPEIGGGSPIASVLPFATFAIEASVPVLLCFRPTRKWGVWLAIGFHMAIALDLRQHFFDFTLTLLPLFLLFVPDEALVAIEARLPRPSERHKRPLVVAFAAAFVVVGLPVPIGAKVLPILLGWAAWLVLFGFILRAVYGASWNSPTVSFRTTLVMTPLLALVVFNGLTPYLEVKTATSFNMYANLVTADGESNHYLVTRTAHLRSVQDDLAIVLQTSDEDLGEYIESGFALPVENLDAYLADHPDTSAVVEIDGQRVEIGAEPNRGYETDAPNPLVRRFGEFRAVAITEPPNCQPEFLVAH